MKGSPKDALDAETLSTTATAFLSKIKQKLPKKSLLLSRRV